MSASGDIFLNWYAAYSVGVEVIDQQHRYLLSLARRLQDAMAQGRAAEVLAPLIRDLTTYARFHFAYEERLFAKLGLESIAAHQKQHAKLLEQVVTLEQEFKSGSLRTGMPTLLFLRNWITGHILNIDKRAFVQVGLAPGSDRLPERVEPATDPS